LYLVESSSTKFQAAFKLKVLQKTMKSDTIAGEDFKKGKGWRKSLNHDELFAPASEFTVDGSLTIFCEVNVIFLH
jgi:hypothetical protein